MSFLSRGCLPLRRQENMMFKVATSMLKEHFADLSAAVHRPAGAAGDCTIRTGERGAL